MTSITSSKEKKLAMNSCMRLGRSLWSANTSCQRKWWKGPSLVETLIERASLIVHRVRSRYLSRRSTSWPPGTRGVYQIVRAAAIFKKVRRPERNASRNNLRAEAAGWKAKEVLALKIYRAHRLSVKFYSAYTGLFQLAVDCSFRCGLSAPGIVHPTQLTSSRDTVWSFAFVFDRKASGVTMTGPVATYDESKKYRRLFLEYLRSNASRFTKYVFRYYQIYFSSVSLCDVSRCVLFSEQWMNEWKKNRYTCMIVLVHFWFNSKIHISFITCKRSLWYSDFCNNRTNVHISFD